MSLLSTLAPALTSALDGQKQAQPQTDPNAVGPGSAGMLANPANTYRMPPPVSVDAPAKVELGNLFDPPDTASTFDFLQNKPQHAWLGEQVANYARGEGQLDDFYAKSRQGMTIEDQNKDLEIQSLYKRAQDFIQQTANLNDKQYQAAVERLHAESQNSPQLEQPGLRAPGFAPIALALLGGLADPNHAAQILASPFNAMQGDQQKQIELARQRYQAQLQAHHDLLDAARTDVGLEGDALARERQGLMDQGRFALDQAQAGERSQDRAREQNRIAAAQNENTSNALLQRYYTAKSLPEMQDWARRYNARQTDATLAIPDERVQSDWHQVAQKRIHDARGEFANSMDRILAQFGEIEGTNLKNLLAERKQIAADNYVDEKSLQTIATGATLRKAAQAERAKEYTAKLTFLGQKQAQDLAFKQANLEVARDRLTAMSSNQAFMQQIALGNLAARQTYDRATIDYRNSALQLRQGVGDKSAGAIKTLDEKLRGLNVAIGQAKVAGDNKKVQSLASKQADLGGQREFLIGLMPPEQQAQDMAANLPGAGVVFQAPQVPQVYDRQPAAGPIVPGAPMAAGAGIGVRPVQQAPAKAGQTKRGVKYRVVQ